MADNANDLDPSIDAHNFVVREEYVFSEGVSTNYGHVIPSFMSVREMINEGLERSSFDAVKDKYGITSERLAKVTRIPLRTLGRRSRFTPDESERILRVGRVFDVAQGVLESGPVAQRWMTAEKRALGGLTPLDACDTEAGALEVEHLLGRLEEGVFA